MIKLILLALVASALAFPAREQLERDISAFRDFTTKFGRTYSDEKEFNYRFYVFRSNLRFIEQHNKEFLNGQHTYTVGVNKFADLTNEEFVKRNGFKQNKKQPAPEVFTDEDVMGLPTTVDWRQKGYVTPIKDQGQCGSCWAFAAVASLEGQHFKKNKKLVSLSEQNLVDCSGPEGDEGCEGGLPDNGFKYVIKNKGIDTEASYPYVAEDESCEYKKSSVGATMTGYTDIQSGSEKALQKAAATIGPIAVGIDASNLSFQLYSGGIYNEPDCSSEELDHGVTVVGYGGKGKGKEYWLVKNSWGDDWGLSGYIKMSRNKNNQCGIATLASYPKV